MTFKGDVHLGDAKARQTADDGPASGGFGSSGNEIAPHASRVLLLAGTSRLGMAGEGEKSDASEPDVGCFGYRVGEAESRWCQQPSGLPPSPAALFFQGGDDGFALVADF